MFDMLEISTNRKVKMPTALIEQQIIKTLKQKHVKYAALFGSRAKGTAKKNSDYDFLIETDPRTNFSMFDLVDLKEDLESILKTDVDLVTLGGLNRFMKDSVIKSSKVLYDDRKR